MNHLRGMWRTASDDQAQTVESLKAQGITEGQTVYRGLTVKLPKPDYRRWLMDLAKRRPELAIENLEKYLVRPFGKHWSTSPGVASSFAQHTDPYHIPIVVEARGWQWSDVLAMHWTGQADFHTFKSDEDEVYLRTDPPEVIAYHFLFDAYTPAIRVTAARSLSPDAQEALDRWQGLNGGIMDNSWLEDAYSASPSEHGKAIRDDLEANRGSVSTMRLYRGERDQNGLLGDWSPRHLRSWTTDRSIARSWVDDDSQVLEQTIPAERIVWVFGGPQSEVIVKSASHHIASDVDEYGGRHRPLMPGEWEGGDPTIDNMEAIFPEDVYDEPRGYTGYREGVAEAARVLRRAKDNPSAMVTIYRACPTEVTEINNGDWVTIVRGYAQMHGDSGNVGNAGDPWHILSATVQARYVMSEGNDIMEWGYTGPDIRNAKTAALPIPGQPPKDATWTIDRREWVDPMQWPEDYPEERKFSDESIVYVAKVEGSTIGVMRLRQRSIDGVWFVWRIEVYNPWGRRGVATSMIERARKDLGRVDHSPESERTDDGMAWSRAVGSRDRRRA